MFTIAELETLVLPPLSLEERIEASASVEAYLAEYVRHVLPPPEWLEQLKRDLGAALKNARREVEVAEVDNAKRRVRGQLPRGQRLQLIDAEIAALEEERRQV